MEYNYLQWVEMKNVHVHSFVDLNGVRRITDDPKLCDTCVNTKRSKSYHPLDGIYT